MKNEGCIFPIAGQKNEDAMGQMILSPNESSWNRKREVDLATQKKKFSTAQW